MKLTSHDKIVIAYVTTMDFLFDLQTKKNISSEYRNRMFGMIFSHLQQNYFPNHNPDEITKFVEEFNMTRAEMKALISNQIIEDAKFANGGIGLDKPLAVHDTILQDSPKPQVSITPREMVDQVIEFYNETDSKTQGCGCRKNNQVCSKKDSGIQGHG